MLPVKSVLSVGYGGPLNEDSEQCVNADDIIHDGIVYTPKRFLDDDDVYSIFEVIHLPKNITQTEFKVFVKMDSKWTSKLSNLISRPLKQS